MAEKFFDRLKGLLGRKALPAGECLWIKQCKGIHTFGMRFPIDAVFLDREKHVVAIKKDLKPNRVTKVFFRAESVLELPAGTIDVTATEAGHEIEII